MPNITPPQVLPMMRPPGANDATWKPHKFIKCSLVRGQDMANSAAYNLVIDGDWFNLDLEDRINGRGLGIDLSQQMRAGGMRQISSVYIDNGAGIGTASIQNINTGQRISCPPNCQGWFPVIAPQDDGKFQVGYVDKFNADAVVDPSWYAPNSVQLGAVPQPAPYTLDFFFTDLPVPPQVWRAVCDYGFSGRFGTTSGNVLIAAGSIISLTSNAVSGTRRQGVYIKASPANVDLVVISFIDPPAPSFITSAILYPGEVLDLRGEACPYNEIRVQSPTFSGRIFWYEVI